MHEKKFVKINNEKISYFEYPAKTEPQRLVLFCHGFPGGNRLTTMAKLLNENGITLEEINYRGDKDSDGKFSFFGSIDDIKALTDELKKRYRDIPITVLGFSMGGFFTCCLVRKHPELFDKIVLLNPLLDLSFVHTPIMKELWEEARTALRLHDMQFYQEELQKMEQEFNPIQFVSELSAKINIVGSTKDEVLPHETTKKFFGQLLNPSEFIPIPGAPHGVRGDEPELINLLVK